MKGVIHLEIDPAELTKEGVLAYRIRLAGGEPKGSRSHPTWTSKEIDLKPGHVIAFQYQFLGKPGYKKFSEWSEIVEIGIPKVDTAPTVPKGEPTIKPLPKPQGFVRAEFVPSQEGAGTVKKP